MELDLQINQFGFCETRTESSFEVYRGKNWQRPITGRDRYNRKIKPYGWNFMKDD
jgi:hypothetical protein